jgi:hypothetical protein
MVSVNNNKYIHIKFCIYIYFKHIMSQISRCDVQLKTTALWNMPLSTSQYFIYIRTEPKADGSFIDPVSQFITIVYPHLKNRHEIVLMPLSDQPVVPAALVEVPSVLFRKDAATPPTHLHSKEALVHWLHHNLSDNAEARTAWSNAHQRLAQRFRDITKDARRSAYRKPSNDDDDCSDDDNSSDEDDCDDDDDESDEDCTSSDESDCDDNHGHKFFEHAPKHTCGK